MKKMGRPPRELKIVTKQTFIPRDMREKLNELAKLKDLSRTDFLLTMIPDLMDMATVLDIRRTHPRSDEGWVLFHVPMTCETAEKANTTVKSMDVSMASWLYSIIVYLSRQENVDI